MTESAFLKKVCEIWYVFEVEHDSLKRTNRNNFCYQITNLLKFNLSVCLFACVFLLRCLLFLQEENELTTQDL